VDTAASTPAQIARKIFAALPDVAAKPAVNGTATAAASTGRGASAKAGVPAAG
jgi:hypothetical protein